MQPKPRGSITGRPTPESLSKSISDTFSAAMANAGKLPGAPAMRRAAAIDAHEEPSGGTWPMTIKEFQDAGYLHPGDVVLMTRLGSFFAWLIHMFDKSNFAHTALMYQTPHDFAGIDHHFIIETSMGGVEIETLDQIVAPGWVFEDTKLPPDFVVGIKRLETDWATHDLRRIAAARMLHFINNDNYDFSMLAALASKRTWNAYTRFIRNFKRPLPTVSQYLKKGTRFSPAEFICSGFIQFAYLDMVKIAIERGLLGQEAAATAWRDVMFADRVDASASMLDVLSVKPRELAETPKLTWKYLVHDGKVYKAGSNDEVNQFFKFVEARHKPLTIPA
jgi:hypothetical protein